MTTIVIADSLIHDFVSPWPEFANVSVNVGALEIARTMGEGAHYGRGPLPAFLHAAHRAPGVHLIFIRDLHDPDDPLQQPELLRYGRHALRGTPGAEFVSAIDDLVPDAHVIETSSLALPTARLHEVLREILGRDVLSLDAADRDDITFVVTGFHTEVRVLSTAFKLRNEYSFAHVLVCPHLVGSREPSGHARALQIGLPDALVTVVPSLHELCERTAITLEEIAHTDACGLEPADVVAHLSDEQRAVLEILFIFDRSVTLVSLKGGFSGSLLFIATPERDGRRQAPAVVKLGPHDEMHRELVGYSRISDLLGTHVPAMQAPVSRGLLTGVRMTLASMEGHPKTLQRLYAEDPMQFTAIFDKALTLLADSLYENTRRQRKFSPYQEFGLTGPQHMKWLRGNLEHILPDAALDPDTLDLGHGISIPNPLVHGPSLLSHVDYVDGDVALCHGDLNLANLITDDTRAIWIIDWPWCDERPIEFDLAKMENDIKFVIDQDFTEDDLPRMAELERVLTATLIPPERPPEIIAEDRRLDRMYHAVRQLRVRYLTLKRDPHVEFHAIALLRFALHTLSFDARRGRGECDLPQLKHALLTVGLLIDVLRKSPLHQGGARDRHPSYPPRFVVPPARASWDTVFDAYAPPRVPSRVSGPEADADEPTDVPDLQARTSLGGPLRLDPRGRPLNPAGRTGLEGRGYFYRWGPNLAVDAVVTRINAGLQTLEFALVKRADTGQWGLPGVLVRSGETPTEAFARLASEKLGLDLDHADVLEQVVVDDYRNTDNAWVESVVFHHHMGDGATRRLETRRGATDTEWLAVNADFAVLLFASHARIIAACIRRMLAREYLRVRRAPLEELLARL